MNESANPFGARGVAELYERGRPFHHSWTLERVAKFVGPLPVARALDVGCGTGMSSRALRTLARLVVGIDPVLRLLEQRVRTNECAYLAAMAEALPFNATSFDAVTVSSAVHWFDQDAFFTEAARVLRPGGWLAIYDHLFLGEIEGDHRFSGWMRNVHQKMLPPPRRGAMFDVSTQTPSRFRRLGDDGFIDLIPMSHRQLVEYLLTQSNAIAAVASGRMSPDKVREWLSSETRPFFEGPSPTPPFRYWGMVTCFALDT